MHAEGERGELAVGLECGAWAWILGCVHMKSSRIIDLLHLEAILGGVGQ